MHVEPATQRRTVRLAAALLLLLATAGAPAKRGSLERAVADAMAAQALASEEVGVCVVALNTRRAVYGHNASRRFRAASNTKLVTAAAALDALGEGYEFRTVLYATGPIEDGTLRGDLVLRGGGDPTIGGRYAAETASRIFRRWARVLRAKGIERVLGDVVADDSFFDRVRRHPDWEGYPAWKWYYGPVSAMSVNDNCVTVAVRPGASAGLPALVTVAPGVAPVRVRNTCRTHARRHAIWFDRAPGSDLIEVGGWVRLGTAGYSDLVSVPDPPLYAAVLLKAVLEQEGLAVGGQARVAEPDEGGPRPGAEPLCTRSVALPAVLRTMLKRSHNQYAEDVIKAVGAEASGRGTWPAGLARAGDMLREMGFGDADFRLADGSGLSRNNELTPELLANLLCRLDGASERPPFRTLLAAPGEEGTLRNRLTQEPYRGAVRAKTGYLRGVGALSGYARTRAGTDVAFAVLINLRPGAAGGRTMRERVDALCRAIVDQAE